MSEGRERGGAAAAVFEDAEHDSAKSIQALQQMTVFGFGRPDWQDPKQHTPPMSGLPARFSIAGTTHF